MGELEDILDYVSELKEDKERASNRLGDAYDFVQSKIKDRLKKAFRSRDGVVWHCRSHGLDIRSDSFADLILEIPKELRYRLDRYVKFDPFAELDFPVEAKLNDGSLKISGLPNDRIRPIVHELREFGHEITGADNYDDPTLDMIDNKIQELLDVRAAVQSTDFTDFEDLFD